MMIWPFRLRTIFRNRWWALAFTGLVLWSAYDFGADREAVSVAPKIASEAASEEQAVADMMNKISSVR